MLSRENILTQFLEVLYPSRCEFCTYPCEPNRALCTSCSDKLIPLESPFCLCCGTAYPHAIDDVAMCPNCHLLDIKFDYARAALVSTPESHELVHQLKYNRQVHLARELAFKMAETIEDDDRFEKLENPLIVSVPMNWKRESKRWYNQSHEIASYLASEIGYELLPALKRVKTVVSQVGLTRQQRLKNMKKVFALKTPKRLAPLISGRNVIIVDDVLTTGSTASSCAEVLKEQGGAKKVVVLTALRG